MVKGLSLAQSSSKEVVHIKSFTEVICCTQTERVTRGRQYSDDESEEEEFYDNESDLMGVARALPSRGPNVGVTAAALPEKASAPKVTKCFFLFYAFRNLQTTHHPYDC